MASVVELSCRLVATPSVLGREGDMAARVSDEMQMLGFDRVEVDDAGSVIGVVEGASPGPTLLMDAHMDTVDVLRREAWTHDPFAGEVADGRLYGRGASDMKGALAAMLCAGGELDRARLHGRLVISASVEEERIEGAALRLVCERFPPDVVVIGEATNLDLVRAGRGRAEVEIVTQGRPAHASTPEQGIHAVLRMMSVVAELEAVPSMEHAFVGRGVMCLTDIISDPYPAHSVVPGGCRVTYERRLLPGETQSGVLGLFREACARAGAEDSEVELARAQLESYTGQSFDEPKWLPPWELPESDVWVAAGLKALRRTGLEPGLSSYSFCTNAAYSAGMAGIPTLGFGPGHESLAHIVDEYVEVAHLEAAVRGYRALAETFLSSSD